MTRTEIIWRRQRAFFFECFFFECDFQKWFWLLFFLYGSTSAIHEGSRVTLYLYHQCAKTCWDQCQYCCRNLLIKRQFISLKNHVFIFYMCPTSLFLFYTDELPTTCHFTIIPKTLYAIQAYILVCTGKWQGIWGAPCLPWYRNMCTDNTNPWPFPMPYHCILFLDSLLLI